MYWFTHLVRAALSRVPAPLLVGAGVLSVGFASVAGFVVLSGESAAVAPDYSAPDYADEVLVQLDVGSAELVEETIASLLPEGISAAERADVISEISAMLGAESVDALGEQLVLRLGARVANAGSSEELIALLVEELNPTGAPMSAAELLAAAEAWSAMTSPNVLRVVSGPGEGPLAGLSTMPFDAVVDVLESASVGEPLVVGLGGVAGLETTVVPGIRWQIDEPSASIGLWGQTDADADSEVFVSLRWGGDPGPTLLLGVPARDWRLAAAGFDGDLGDTALPDTTFLISPTRSVATAGEFSSSMWQRITADHPAPLPELLIEAGVNALTSFESSVLPDAVEDVMADGAAGVLSVRASLGASAGVIDGSAVPDTATLAVVMPGLDPPALPDWLSPSDDLPWSLTLTVSNADGLDIGLAGGLDASIDGGVREFAARFELEADDGTAAGRLVGDLRSPWVAPFGVDWLTLDDLVMTVDLDADSAAAAFDASVWIADRQAQLEFALAADADTTSVELLASIDRLTAADASTFLARVSGASLPDQLPEVELSDVLIEISAGDGVTIGIGAMATIADQQADVLLSVESVPPSGRGVVFGVALDEWALRDALPALDGTALDSIVFPPTALIVSTIDGAVDPAALSAPAGRFFGNVGGGRALTLSPGVSIHGELDLAGTELEAPLEALGFDGGSLPVVGTLPGSVLGMGGGGSAGSPLADLALEVQLPEISGAGGPDWFERGRLALVVSGQPSLGLQGDMTVVVDGEELTFVVGAEFRRVPLGLELALFGELETQRPWESPFGVEWLVVNGAALELTVDPVGTVGLGFAGDVVIGSKDIQAAIGVELTGGVPTNFLLAASSAEGVSTNDLLAVQRRMASAAGVDGSVDASRYPELFIRDMELRFAPQASERLGVDAGFVVAGDVYAPIGGEAPSQVAFLDVRLTERGLFAQGAANAFRVGPLAWSDLFLDLELSLDGAHMILDGEVSLFDLSVETDVDLDGDSIVMKGREALAELEAIIEAFEAVMDDPGGAIDRVPEIFADAGVPLDPWMEDLFAQLADLARQGQVVSDVAIHAILNGGAIPLSEFPTGGADPRCPISAPIESGGRCYTALALVSDEGVPAGGSAKTCPSLYPRESGGRCYTIRPTTEKICPVGSIPLVTNSNKCRKGFDTVNKITVSVPGVPSGGRAKTCGVLNEVGGRCYVISPGEITPAVPEGGADYVCPVSTPTEEGGRCWTVTPSQAERGLGVQGLCKQYAEVSCTVEDLVRANLLGKLVDWLIERFDSW